MKKQIVTLLLIQLISVCGYSQLIVKDTTTIFGTIIFDNGEMKNARQCSTLTDGKDLNYTPDEVSLYKIGDKTYKSFRIDVDGKPANYFLEQLIEGRINLYYVALSKGIRRFYVSENESSGITELHEADYRKMLEKYFADCPTALRNIPYVKFERYALQKFFRNYIICRETPLFRTRFGVEAGGVLTHFTSSKELKRPFPDNNIYFRTVFGCFADIPVGSYNFSFHPKVLYRQLNVNGGYVNDYQLTNDVVVNYTALSIPLLARYSFISDKFSPYVQAGPVYQRALRNEGTVYDYTPEANNTILTDITNAPLMPDNMFGFNIGCGLIFGYKSGYSFFTELNYTPLYSPDRLNTHLDIQDISLVIGLQF